MKTCELLSKLYNKENTMRLGKPVAILRQFSLVACLGFMAYQPL